MAGKSMRRKEKSRVGHQRSAQHKQEHLLSKHSQGSANKLLPFL